MAPRHEYKFLFRFRLFLFTHSSYSYAFETIFCESMHVSEKMKKIWNKNQTNLNIVCAYF